VEDSEGKLVEEFEYLKQADDSGTAKYYNASRCGRGKSRAEELEGSELIRGEICGSVIDPQYIDSLLFSDNSTQ
jgi:hypothetical protein